MRSTKQMSITLPFDMAKTIKDKVASGEYSTNCQDIFLGLTHCPETCGRISPS